MLLSVAKAANACLIISKIIVMKRIARPIYNNKENTNNSKKMKTILTRIKLRISIWIRILIRIWITIWISMRIAARIIICIEVTI